MAVSNVVKKFLNDPTVLEYLNENRFVPPTAFDEYLYV